MLHNFITTNGSRSLGRQLKKYQRSNVAWASILLGYQFHRSFWCNGVRFLRGSGHWRTAILFTVLISWYRPPSPSFLFLFSVNLLTWVDHLLRTEAAIGRRPSWNGHLLLFVSWVDINSKSMATTWYVRKLQLDNLLKAIGKVKVTVAWILEFTNESALLAHLTRLYLGAYFRYLGE